MSVQLEQRAGAAAARPREAAARRAEVNFERLRAPFSLRLGALLVDYIIVISVVVFATLLARAFDDGRRGGGLLLTTGYLVALGVAFLNFVVVPAFSGRTVGKWVAGLRIERRDGVSLSIGRALLRHLVGYPLTLLTLGIGFLFAAFSSEGRALHDFLAGTVVVRSRPSRG